MDSQFDRKFQMSGPPSRKCNEDLLLIGVLLCLSHLPGLAANFCAAVNTAGSSFQSGKAQNVRMLSIAVFSLYQSAGACINTCNGYAFAILQDHVKFSMCSILILVRSAGVRTFHQRRQYQPAFATNLALGIQVARFRRPAGADIHL